MLQLIHNKLNGIFAWVIIVISGLAVTLWGVNYYIKNSHPDIIAQVDNEIVSKQFVQQIYQHIAKDLSRSHPQGALPEEIEKLIKKEALDYAILYHTLRANENHSGIVVTNEMVTDILQRDEMFFENNVFSRDKLERFWHGTGFSSLQYFLDFFTMQVMLSQIRVGFADSEFITDYEYDKWIKLLAQKRDVMYVHIPLDKLKKSVTVADQEVKHYYDTHSQEFKEPEQIQLQYIQLSLEDLKNNVKVSNEEVEGYYQQNKNNYKHPKKFKIEKVVVPFTAKDKDEKLAKINDVYKGPDRASNFLKLAKKIPGAKANTLLVNEAEENIKVADELNKALTATNKVTPVMVVGEELVIAKVMSSTPAIPKSFNEVQAEIKKYLMQERAGRLYSELTEELSDLSYTYPDSLDKASKTLKFPIKETKLFSKNVSVPKDGSILKENVLDAVFKDDVYVQKNNSALLPIGDNNVVVVRISKVVPEKLLPFASVANKIRNDLINKEAYKKLVDLGNTLLNKLKANTDVNNLLEEYAIKWEKATDLDSTADYRGSEWKMRVFDLSAEDNIMQVVNKDSVVLIKLLAIKYPDPNKVDKKTKEIVVYGSKEYYKEAILNDYFASLKRNCKITIYNHEDKE